MKALKIFMISVIFCFSCPPGDIPPKEQRQDQVIFVPQTSTDNLLKESKVETQPEKVAPATAEEDYHFGVSGSIFRNLKKGDYELQLEMAAFAARDKKGNYWIINFDPETFDARRDLKDERLFQMLELRGSCVKQLKDFVLLPKRCVKNESYKSWPTIRNWLARELRSRVVLVKNIKKFLEQGIEDVRIVKAGGPVFFWRGYNLPSFAMKDKKGNYWIVDIPQQEGRGLFSVRPILNSCIKDLERFEGFEALPRRCLGEEKMQAWKRVKTWLLENKEQDQLGPFIPEIERYVNLKYTQQ